MHFKIGKKGGTPVMDLLYQNEAMKQALNNLDQTVRDAFPSEKDYDTSTKAGKMKFERDKSLFITMQVRMRKIKSTIQERESFIVENSHAEMLSFRINHGE